MPQTAGANMSSWWTSALWGGSMPGLWLLFCGCGLVLVILGRTVWRDRVGLRVLARRLRGERGTATIEFALVTPLLAMVFLTMLQTMLVMTGNFFVHYAAAVAARSAIVSIPLDLADDGAEMANEVYPTDGSPKYQAIRRSAVLAVMPVAGRLGGGAPGAGGGSLASELATHYEAYSQPSPRWVENFVDARMAYADVHTRVELWVVNTPEDSAEVTFDRIAPAAGYEFAPREPVAVSVEHRLNLSIPYARAFFSDGTHRTADGETAYTDVAARSLLHNQGIDTALPPEPEVPRVD
jgi:Flp pilus assembly pilin Flp